MTGRSSLSLVFLACIVISFLLSMSLLQHTMADSTTSKSPQTLRRYPPRRINCPAECRRRCSKARMSDKYYSCCIPCCHKCSCVPPGTYGNKQMCSCYANMKNSKNGASKCP